MLDANEAVGDSAHGITSVMSECALLDIRHAIHPDIEVPVTYDRGSKTIDHILGYKHFHT